MVNSIHISGFCEVKLSCDKCIGIKRKVKLSSNEYVDTKRKLKWSCNNSHRDMMARVLI